MLKTWTRALSIQLGCKKLLKVPAERLYTTGRPRCITTVLNLELENGENWYTTQERSEEPFPGQFSLTGSDEDWEWGLGDSSPLGVMGGVWSWAHLLPSQISVHACSGSEQELGALQLYTQWSVSTAVCLCLVNDISATWNSDTFEYYGDMYETTHLNMRCGQVTALVIL